MSSSEFGSSSKRKEMSIWNPQRAAASFKAAAFFVSRKRNKCTAQTVWSAIDGERDFKEEISTFNGLLRERDQTKHSPQYLLPMISRRKFLSTVIVSATLAGRVKDTLAYSPQRPFATNSQSLTRPG